MPEIERTGEKELKFLSRMHLISQPLYTIQYMHNKLALREVLKLTNVSVKVS